MVLEDAHWIDPTSRELLDLTVERVRTLAVLLIATFRLGFHPPWTGQPHVTTTSLRRLERVESGKLVRGIIGDAAALSGELVNEIVEQTDGIPLFIEELAKAVLENAIVGAAPAASLAVPATLHASLMARLDRLGPMAKEVAQIGATIGREFSFQLLATTAERNPLELQRATASLVEAGLIFQRGLPREASFLFKHALVQDVAYSMLLRGPRQLLHARIADALIVSAGEKSAAAPEIIAHHLQNAGRPTEAVHFWREAGEQAARHAANREAVEHLRRALSAIQAQPETGERWRAELAILSRLAPALMSVHGWSASQVGEAVNRATEVARRIESSADLAPSIANLWFFNFARGRFDQADEISGDLFRIARELDDREIMLQAHHCAWPLRVHRGLFTAASEHIDACLSLYREERHAHHRHLYLGHDPAVCALATGGTVQWPLGYPDRSRRLAGEAIALARRLEHAPSLANALRQACETEAARCDAAAVIAAATELLKVSEEHEFPQHRGFALAFRGWALSRSGETSEGISQLERGDHILNQMGQGYGMTRRLCFLAESNLMVGRYADGLEHVARALEIAAQTGEGWSLSRLYRVRAELSLNANGPGDEGAEASLRRALAVAQEQSARGWELQAAILLAKLWLDRARRDDARNLLAPVYGWFTEGFDTPDLKDAKALLDELA